MDATRTVKLSEAAKYLKLHAKSKRPVFLWGPPGVGKSELVESVCGSYDNSLLIDIRLSVYDPTDLKGYPAPDLENKQMVWLPSVDLPTPEQAEQYDTIWLFLDELNGAAQAVQAAAYQLILNRRIGQYELPDNVVVVAAGNRDGDKGVTYRMPKPLANRFIHYEIRVDFEDWLTWATDNNVHPDVVGYITFVKGDLYNFDATSSDRSFATPRTWTYASDTLHELDILVDEFGHEDVTNMIAGTVGEGTAIKFMAHRKISANLPNPSDILSGKVKELKTKEISAMYSLSTSMAYELKAKYDVIGRSLKQEEFADLLDNCLGFWLKNFDPEMIIMATRLVFVQYGVKAQLRKLKNWTEFMKSYGHLIKEA
jgi:hypothetical protein